MRKSFLLYTGFFIVLLIAFYAVMLRVTDMGKPQLPILNTVRPFSFIRQDGQTVTERNIVGKTCVVEYFFTSCKGICPKMNTNMVQVYRALGADSSFLILSHTVDPQTDSVATLKHYADSLGVKLNNWWFLTGPKADLYKAARESYVLDDPNNSSKNITEQFLHTQFFALVDRNGRVRGIYDGIRKEEVNQLIEDARTLMKE